MLMALTGFASAQAQEAYAVVTNEDGAHVAVAFYYNTNKASFNGLDNTTVVENLNEEGVSNKWCGSSVRTVTFDESFKNYTGLTSLYRWFYYCSALREIDVTNLNVTNVTRTEDMFAGCSKLETIYAAAGTNWDTGKITNSSSMFDGCTSLVGGALTSYYQYAVGVSRARIDGGSANPGYFTDPTKPIAYAAVTMNADSKPEAVSFYYDTESANRGSNPNVVIVKDLNRQHPWTGSSLTSATFDASFANVTGLTNLSDWFSGCSALTSISGLEYLNTSKVTSMYYMFANCSSLTELDLTHFDVSSLTDTRDMFYNCSNLDAIYATGDWKTDKLTDYNDMFSACNKLVGSAGTVYDSSSNTIDFAHVDGGPSAPGFFSQKGVDLAYAAVEKNAEGKAVAVTFYYDKDKETRKAEGKTIVRTLNSPNAYQEWAGSTLTSVTFDSSFKDYTGLTSLYRWFSNCSNLTSITGLENLNTTNVTTMADMFSWCSLTELDLSAFNTANVTEMSYMFSYCTNLLTIYAGNGWTVGAGAATTSMFLNCNALVGGLGTYYNSEKTNGTMAHIDGGAANPGYFSRKGDPVAYAVVTKNSDNQPVAVSFYYDTKKDSRATENTTILTRLNANTAAPNWTGATLTSVTFDESFGNYHDLTSLYRWFYSCSALTGITGLEYLNTENVTTMENMFKGCGALIELDLTNFNVGKVTSTYMMFDQCTSLETIFAATDWNTETNTNDAYMFYRCTKLMGGAMTLYDSSNNNDKTYAHPDGGSANPGYFTDKTQPRPYAVVTKNSDSQPVAVGFFYDTQMSSHRADNVTILRALNGNTIAQSWTGATLTSVTFDSSFGNYHGLKSLAGWFSGCSALTSIDLSNLHTENVTTMASMFSGCTGLTSIDLSTLSTENVTTMSSMFSGCTGFTELDLSGFDMTNVTNTASMFYNCRNLETIYAAANADWTGDAITSSAQMFSSCEKLVGGNGTYYTSNIQDKARACIDGLLGKPGYFSVKNAPRPYALLSADKTTLTFFYDTELATRRAATENADATFLLKLSNNSNSSSSSGKPVWATTALTTVNFDASFKNYKGLTGLSNWFNGCTALATINGLGNLNTENVTTMFYMFNDCRALTSLDLSGFNTAKVTTMSYMFFGCSALESITFGSAFTTAEVTSMSGMFRQCSVLTALDLSGFNTAKVTTMSDMFNGCSALSTITFGPQFTTAQVTSTNGMFYNCSALTELNLTTFTVEALTDASYMFNGCSMLETINAAADADWTGATLNSSYNMFAGCSKLVGGYGTVFYSSDKSYARIDKEGQPGYFTNPAAPRPYAILSADKTAVTFYYDTELATRRAAAENEGATFVLKLNNNSNGSSNKPVWATATLKNVTFDASFASYKGLKALNYWFYYCTGLKEINVANLNIENVVMTYNMFNGCTNLETIYAPAGTDWSTSAGNTFSDMMFYNCSKLVGGNGTTYTNNPSDKTRARIDGLGGQPGYFTDPAAPQPYALLTADQTAVTFYYDAELATRKAENADATFVMLMASRGNEVPAWATSTLTSVTFDNSFDQCHSLKDLSLWFSGCSSLTSIDLSKLHTENVTTMASMFYNCLALTQLDVSGLDITKVTDTYQMFYSCTSLETIYATAGTNWNLETITSSSSMFHNCPKLVGGYGTIYTSATDQTQDKNRACIDTPDHPGYFTDPAAARPYAMVTLNEESKPIAVSFFYDTELATRKAGNPDATFALALSNNNNNYNSPTAWNSATLTSVTFDESFKNYKGLTGLSNWFSGCSSLASIDLSNLNTENVTTMYYMFSSCSALTSLDLSGFDVGKLTSTGWMFSGCTNLETIYAATGTNWNAITSSSYMFQYCSKLVGGNGTTYNSSYTDKARACIDGLEGQPGYFTDPTAARPYALLSADKTAVAFYYDTELATRKAAPENAGATVLFKLSSYGATPVWATATLTSATFDESFKDFTGLTDLRFWFNNCTGLTSLDLTNLSTPNVTLMASMFYGCTNLVSITFSERFSTANVTRMDAMFNGCSALTQLDLSSFNTAKVTEMNSMFSRCSNLNAITFGSGFTTPLVTKMSSMFSGCTALTELDLSTFSPESVNDTQSMFDGCSALETIYAAPEANWNVSSLLWDNYMFSNCSKLVGGNGTNYEYGYTSKTRACIDGLNGQPGYFTDKAKDRAYAMLSADKTAVTFYYDKQAATRKADPANDGATFVYRLKYVEENVLAAWRTTSLTTVSFDPSFKDYAGLTNTSNWFRDCTGLTTINGLENLNTENVTSMVYMFQNCSALTEIDVSGFATEKLTSIDYMFSGCTNLKTIYAKAGTNWNTNTPTSRYMFLRCNALVGGRGTAYRYNTMADVDANWARIDGLDGQPGYFTDPDAFLLGDVNNDGDVTIADVTALVNIILGKSTDYDEQLADVNGDKSVTIADVTALVNIILGKDQ